MKGKRFFSLFLSLALCATLALPARASEPWYAEAQAFVTENGIMKGTDKGFEPDGIVTWATVFQIMYNLAGKPQVETAASVEGQWYAQAASYALSMALVDSFAEDGPINRLEIARLLAKDLEHSGYTVEVEKKDITLLPDYADIVAMDESALPAVELCYSAGLLKGNDKGEWMPAGTVTRAQYAQILFNQDKLSKAPAPDGEPSQDPITQEDALQCVQVELDTTYKGSFEGFLDFYSNVTLADAQAQYEANIVGEADFFLACYGLLGLEDDSTYQLPSEAQLARLYSLFREIYAKSSYTVLSAQEQADGSFALQVELRPLDLYRRMDAGFDAYFEDFWAEIEQIDLDAMSDEEFALWYVNEYTPTYYDTLLDLLEAQVPSMNYLAPQTVTVLLRQAEDGSLFISEESWVAVDNQIIDYTTEE